MPPLAIARFCRILVCRAAPSPFAFLCCCFQIRERGDTQILVKPQHFFGPQPGDGEHLKYPGWDLLAELLQTGVGTRTMQLGDDVGDGFANAGNFGEPFLLDQAVERFG
jgi:hypothetical protein